MEDKKKIAAQGFGSDEEGGDDAVGDEKGFLGEADGVGWVVQADEATGGDVGRGVAEEVGEAARTERVAEARQADAPHGAEAGHEVLIVTHIVVRHFALSVGAAGEDAGAVGG